MSDGESSQGSQERNLTEDEVTLLSLTRSRNGLASSAKKEMRRAADLLNAEPLNHRLLQACRAKLLDYQNRYSSISLQIRRSYTSLGDRVRLTKDIDAGVNFEDEISQALGDVESGLSPAVAHAIPAGNVLQPANLPPNANVVQVSPPAQTPDWNAKLPVLDVEKFSGDPMKWEPFKDTFLAVVDARQMPAAQKFRYLKSYLSGDALRMLDGYHATEASYQSAWSALEERYGDPNLATFAHLSAMMDLKPLTGYNVDQLIRLRDECECHIRSLVALGLDESTFEKVFTPLIMSKLPMAVRFELNREMMDQPQPWSLGRLRELLRKEIRARDMSKRQGDMHTQQRSHEKWKPSEREKSGSQEGASASMLPTVKNADDGSEKKSSESQKKQMGNRCKFCTGNHWSDECTEYSDASSRIRRLGPGCHSCLGSRHKINECYLRRVCYYCKSRSHHRSLCYQKFGSPEKGKGKVNVTTAAENYTEESDPFLVETLAATGNKYVHMQTAVAVVRNTEGTKQAKVRLLFDTAASRSFVSTRKASQIDAKQCGTESMSIAGFEQNSRKSKSYKVVEFDVICRDGNKQRVEARVTDTLTCPISKPVLDVSKYPAAKTLQLAEPCVDGCELLNVDVLIGADHYYDFITGEIIREVDGLIFVSSRLGHLTCGSSGEVGQPDSIVQVVLAAPEVGIESNFDIEKFWRIEEAGIKSEELKKTSGDEEALLNFQRTVRFEDGRYSVTLPWKEVHPELQSHYHLCKGRLRSLVRRLSQKKDILSKYDQTIRDQFEKGVIEPAPLKADGCVHYIPHHEVLTPQKTTTKLRVVYDCSAKLNGEDVSLNDCLYRGPVILENMCGLLMRFRLHDIAIISDIEKAFLQIAVQVQDRDVLRFLWLKDIHGAVSKENLIEFRFARVLFGANSSPSLLGMTVDHHLRSVGTQTAVQAAEDMFVDNNVTGVASVEEGARYYAELKAILELGTMNLREWFTSSTELKQHFDSNDQGAGDSTKVLGILWNTIKDDICCSGKFGGAVRTKRDVVSAVATLFDPCGWFGPIALPAKLLIRDIWQQKCEWDRELPSDLSVRWSKLVSSLTAIGGHTLPRRLTNRLSVKGSNRQLHCFVDASAQAYAAAVYLRCESDGVVEASLLFSKNRVSPLKPTMTIPKLELMAATLGADLLEFVEKELRMGNLDKYLWSDSQCVLHWINAGNKATVFVANRVKRIRAVPNVTIRYVPTQLNPADLASRGVEFEKLVKCDAWWFGPEFLRMASSGWPQWELSTKATTDVPEEKFPSNPVLPLMNVEQDFDVDVSRFSRLSRLLRATAYVRRFAHNARRPNERRSGLLTADELARARLDLDKLAQSQLPSLDAEEVNRRNQLAVFTDRDGLLRCKSRLGESELPFAARFPKLMPERHHYTLLLIRDAHDRANHAGVAQTLVKLREEYWIPRGRATVKRMIKSCRLCRKLSGGVYRAPTMPELPQFRVNRSVPFQCVGLDYVGPLFVKTTNSQAKVWICLLTCAATRAVHLEVVENMTTSHFMLAFRRFVARYGYPKVVVSDNAKQFVTGVETMAKVWQDVTTSGEVQNFSSIRGIRWKFITEKAPWFGGFYERLVGCVKNGLKRALDKKRVTLVELQTVVCEVTTVVNERPLVYVEAEPGQMVLTPLHFLRQTMPGQQSLEVEEDDNEFVPAPVLADELVKEYQRVKRMVHHFWQVWHREYLVSLRCQFEHKGQKGSVSIVPRVGDMVVVADEGMPRGTWKLGRVVAVKVSLDGEIRSATVKTPNGSELRRPVKLLVPLEVEVPGNRQPQAEVEADPTSQDSQKAEDKTLRSGRAAARRARSAIRNILAAEDEED